MPPKPPTSRPAVQPAKPASVAAPTPPEDEYESDTPPPVTPNPNAWTVRKLLAWINQALTSQKIESPRLCAEILLADCLQCERLKLYLDPDRELEPVQLERLRKLVARALKHEPIQYLTAEAWFFGLPLTVDSRVLIPRPSTETIVEEVIQAVRRARAAAAPQEPETPPSAEPAEPKPAAKPARPAKTLVGEGLLIVDVCTGSGCIAIALAKQLTGARFIATDLSADALEVAALNAKRHAVADRIEFRQGNLLTPLADVAGTVDFLVSNPPYIPDHEWDAVEANVKNFEPHAALRAGQTGLEFVQPVIEGAAGLLKSGGAVLVEIAACTAVLAKGIAAASNLAETRVLRDSDGLERVIVAKSSRSVTA